MSKINVSFVTHDPNLKSGGSLSLLNLIDSLSGTEIVPSVFLPASGEFSSALEKRNVSYKIIPNTFWTSSFDGKKRSARRKFYIFRKNVKKLFSLLIYMPRYIYYLNKWQSDIVYTNTTVIYEGAIAAFILNKPHIWHVRELKDIHFKYDFGNSLFKFFFSKAKAQIFVSEALAEALTAYLIPEHTHIVYNGIAPKPITKGQKERNVYTFCMVGTIQSRKNQAEAIEAIAILKDKYPKTCLLIAGNGESTYVRSLKKLVEDLEVKDSVHFIGTVEEPFNQVYALSDAYLMCSTNETFGRVTVEAMFSKLPVIGYKSEITGTKEIIEDKVTGLLYEGGAEKLSASMMQFLDNPEWAKELGQRGFIRASQKFGIATYSANIISIIKNVKSRYYHKID